MRYNKREEARNTVLKHIIYYGEPRGTNCTIKYDIQSIIYCLQSLTLQKLLFSTTQVTEQLA